MWERVVGNPLALSKGTLSMLNSCIHYSRDKSISDAYSSCLSRAKSLLSSRRFPTTALSLIESDISTTLPQLHIFHRHYGPLYEDLYHLLCAWVIARADEGLGYVEGIAKVRTSTKFFSVLFYSSKPDRRDATFELEQSESSFHGHAEFIGKKLFTCFLWWS